MRLLDKFSSKKIVNPDLNDQHAFMMPMVILMMGVMMIVGTAALSQATNSFNLGLRQNYGNIALQAAESGIEYASVRYKNGCSTWIPSDSSVGEFSYINDSSLGYKVTLQVVPNITLDSTSACGNYNADVIAKVYVPASSTTAKYAKTLKTSFSRTGSASASSSTGGGAGVNVNAQLNTFVVGGHTFVFGVMGNTKAAYGLNPSYFICLDQSKTYSVNNDSQACEGSNNGGTGTMAANTYLDSSMLYNVPTNLVSPATGIGGSYTGSGTGSNLFMVDGTSYFDKAADGTNGNFYFSVQRTPASGTTPTTVNTDAGWACVNISASGIKNCGFRKVGNIAPAFTTNVFAGPQWMFTATTYKAGKLYGISGTAKTNSTTKDRIYCWDTTTNPQAVCAGQPYLSNLPDYLPSQHQFFDYGPYGFYAWGTPYPNDVTPDNGKIYWTGNYSTYSNPHWERQIYYPPWHQTNLEGSQYNIGSKIDCFDTTLATPGPCFTATDTSNYLNGQNTLPYSNAAATIPGLITNNLVHGADYFYNYAPFYSIAYLGFTSSPFFQRNAAGTPTGLCQSTQQDQAMHIIGRAPLLCYSLTTGQSQTFPASLNAAIQYDYTLGTSAETKTKIYTPYTINDTLLVSLGLDWTKTDTFNWQPAIKRSRGFCFDWTIQAVCSGWGGGTGIVNWAGPPVPATLSSNANPGVFSFTVDGSCLNASSIYGASLFTVYQSDGTYGCSASSSTRGIIR